MTEVPSQAATEVPSSKLVHPSQRPTPQPQQGGTGRWVVAKLLIGLLLLSSLAYFLWTKGDWKAQIFIWVLITILADELGGWFGYIALCLIALVFFAPYQMANEWFAITPLVGGALCALLMVKHSGKILVLPFAGLIFYGTIWAAEFISPRLDSSMKLTSNTDFQRMAVLAMLIGLGFSFLRQLGVWAWQKWYVHSNNKKVELRFQQAMRPVDQSAAPKQHPQGKPRP